MENLLSEEKKCICTICNYSTKWSSDFRKHNLTAKHKAKMSSFDKNEPSEITKKKFKCNNCEKEYLASSGLWYHQKKCKEIKKGETEKCVELPKQEQSNTLILDPATVLELIRQNQEFKSLIIDQQNKIIELVSKPNTINTMTNSNNNNTFNLQFFLNETCKDAMNISEFIGNLNIQLKELENVGNNGYITGISDIILKRMKVLDISKRPVHCTDIKRETMYIRDENEWNKDTEEKTKLKNVIEQVANQNIQKIPEWREENPE